MGVSNLGSPCHRTANFAIRAFAGALESQARDGLVSVEAIRRLRDALAREPGPLAPSFASAEHSCVSAFQARQMHQVRRNYVGRIVVKRLGDLVADDGPDLSRSQLGPLFNALRIIIGEEVYESLQDQCSQVLATLDADDPGRWDAFYAHPEIRLIGERICVSLARSFRRFEPRKEWFLTVMNSNLASQSLGSSAFVVRKPAAVPVSGRYFGEVQLARLLTALFAPFRDLAGDDARAFEARWGSAPGAVFGPIFVEIARIGAKG
jgi:hypothetical protein